MTSAEERIENIKAQIEAIERGERTVITCPYCGGVNTETEEFCCDLCFKSAIAALERIRVEQAYEKAKRIQERHSRN